MVIPSGARYRRLDVPNLRQFEGRGVWYWASPIEARLCRHDEIALVGAGNSAGQAAVFLRDYAAKIWLLVRGPSLAESMSQYLIDRINATPNIEVLKNTEVVALSGSSQGQLQRVRWRHRPSGNETENPLRHLFLFIGAEPATHWLQGCVSLDAKGFVQTGASIPTQGVRCDRSEVQPLSLQCSVPGVFAVGDVRSGSVKRVGAAIGEGAAVVAQLHGYLAAKRAACRGPTSGPRLLIHAWQTCYVAGGAPLVKGKSVTGFSNSEESAVGLTHVVPFLVQDMLKELGARYSKAADWQPYAVVDGNPITGQNPASSEGSGWLVLDQLIGRDARRAVQPRNETAAQTSSRS